MRLVIPKEVLRIVIERVDELESEKQDGEVVK